MQMSHVVIFAAEDAATRDRIQELVNSSLKNDGFSRSDDVLWKNSSYNGFEINVLEVRNTPAFLQNYRQEFYGVRIHFEAVVTDFRYDIISYQIAEMQKLVRCSQGALATIDGCEQRLIDLLKRESLVFHHIVSQPIM